MGKITKWKWERLGREDDVFGGKKRKKSYKEEKRKGKRARHLKRKMQGRYNISVSETDYISYLPIDIKLESL